MKRRTRTTQQIWLVSAKDRGGQCKKSKGVRGAASYQTCNGEETGEIDVGRRSDKVVIEEVAKEPGCRNGMRILTSATR